MAHFLRAILDRRMNNIRVAAVPVSPRDDEEVQCNGGQIILPFRQAIGLMSNIERAIVNGRNIIAKNTLST